jgi:hypothetical protein
MPRSVYQDNSNKEYLPKSYQDSVPPSIDNQVKLSPLINNIAN